MQLPLAIGFKGLINNISPSTMQADETGKIGLSTCNNVFISDEYTIKSCAGKVLTRESTLINSLFVIEEAMYYVQSNLLCSDGYLVKELPSSGPWQCVSIGDRYYLSDGESLLVRYPNGVIYKNEQSKITEKDNTIYTSMPGGKFLDTGFGRLFCARTNAVYFSRSFDPRYIREATNVIPFKSTIKMLKTVKQGLWVADTDTLYWLEYKGNTWTITEKFKAKMYEGIPPLVSASLLPIDGLQGLGIIYPTSEGILFLDEKGDFFNLTPQLELKHTDLSPLLLTNFSSIIQGNKCYVSFWGSETLGLIINLKNLAVTQHTEYLFKSAVKYKEKYFGVFEDGIYELFNSSMRVDSYFSFPVNTPKPVSFRKIHIRGQFINDITLILSCYPYGIPQNITPGTEQAKISYPVEVVQDYSVTEKTVFLGRGNGVDTNWIITIQSTEGRRFNILQLTGTLLRRALL